jgi:hypothetical protein
MYFAAHSANVFDAARGRRSAPGGLLGVDRIDPLPDKFARVPRLLACQRKRDFREAAETHLGTTAGEGKAQQPAARFSCDVEAEPWHFADGMKPVAPES